jgi:hypothetical protein
VMAGLLEGAQEGGLGGEGNAAVVVVFVAATIASTMVERTM